MVAPDKRCNFDNVTEGDTLSAANTATSGNAIATPTVSGTGSAVANASAALRGAKGVTISGVSSDVFAIRLTQSAAGSMSCQIYRRLSAASRPSSGTTVICRIRHASGNAAILVQNSSGVCIVQNAAGTGIKNLNSNSALADGDYVFNLMVTKGTTTSNGRIGCTVRDVATDTLQSDCNYDSGTTVNAGTADLTEAQSGIPSALSGNLTAIIDEFACVNSFNEIDRVSADLTATVDLGYIPVKVEGGTGGPYTLVFDSGGPTDVITYEDGTTLDFALFGVEQHASDTLVIHAEDASSNELVLDSIPPIPTGGSGAWPKVWNGSAWE